MGPGIGPRGSHKERPRKLLSDALPLFPGRRRQPTVAEITRRRDGSRVHYRSAGIHTSARLVVYRNPPYLFYLLENIFRQEHRRHRSGPSRVECEMRNQLDDFVLCDAILQCTLKMKAQLLGAI